jgi:hypothetical protein
MKCRRELQPREVAQHSQLCKSKPQRSGPDAVVTWTSRGENDKRVYYDVTIFHATAAAYASGRTTTQVERIVHEKQAKYTSRCGQNESFEVILFFALGGLHSGAAALLQALADRLDRPVQELAAEVQLTMFAQVSEAIEGCSQRLARVMVT